MIIANTITSPAVGNLSAVTAAGDDNPVLGWSGVGNGRNWVGTPGSFNAALQTITAASGANAANNIDWTTGGFFTVTQYAGAYTIAFWTAATYANPTGSQILSASLGQTIAIYIPALGSAAITWPSTITWFGIGVSGSCVATAPTTTTNATLIYITCTAVGSSPTFIAFYFTN